MQYRNAALLLFAAAQRTFEDAGSAICGKVVTLGVKR